MTDSEIKKALECCGTDDCYHCPMGHHTTGTYNENCGSDLMKLALDLINRLQAEKEELQELVNEMSDYFPACIGCEGKTEDGVRTDKCVFLIDKTNYCVKRGISNIVAIRKENAELKADIERLQEEICIQRKIIDERGAEVLRHDRCIRTLHEKLETAKAEAYKECIEEVKENIKNLEYNAKTPRKTVKVEELEEQMDWVLHTVIIETLDNLLKELVGEDK